MNIQPEVQRALNALLRHELTLINQYFLHARFLNHMGYQTLGKHVYRQSIRAMKQADALINRIFLLEGLPNLQDLGKLFVGETVEETLNCDLTATRAEFNDAKAAIALLEAEKDYVSRALVEAFLKDSEEYIDWLETQLDLLNDLGVENYLQQAV